MVNKPQIDIDEFLTETEDGTALILVPRADEPGTSLDGLADGLFEEITDLYNQQARLANQGAFGATIPILLKAISLLPAPRSQWPMSSELYGLLGDSCFEVGLFTVTTAALGEALKCPAADQNALIWLRLGQSLVELELVDAARVPLNRAYQINPEIFEGLDEKYRQLVTSS